MAEVNKDLEELLSDDDNLKKAINIIQSKSYVVKTKDDYNLMDETIRIIPCLSHKIVFHIGPHPWLVSGLLSSYIYATYCNVYTVQCNVR